MHRTPNWTELKEKNSELERVMGKDPSGSTEREIKESVQKNRVKEKYYDIDVIVNHKKDNQKGKHLKR